ncbi:2824_t:CDS:2 [Ambispora gerdemannii]|uniref:2824_t:CDS:1 n=1 Tax=Ambispora gerdemannii TaxID=144530 RepID=A0A9N9BS47_9GLOM|nr:2824_t:CDS:2 [Ambispora gerdemannii]
MAKEEQKESQGDASFYELDDEKTILSLKLPQNLLSEWFHGRSIALFICLDISGSMAGSGIRQAKQAILTLLEGVLTTGACKEEEVTCFFFNHGCQEVPFADNPSLRWENGGIKAYFENIAATGGTNFSAVYESIVKHISNVKTDLAVIFFTDGQTTPVSQEKQDALAHALSHSKYGTEVHTVGFTGDHDAVILSWLTKLGTKQGNFQYVKSSSDIPNTMKTTLELLALGDRNVFVKIGGQELQTSFDNEGRGRLVLTGENKNVRDKKITILKEKEGVNTHIVDALREVNQSDPEATLLTIPFIQHEITRLTNEVVANSDEDGDREKLNEIANEAEKYDAKLNVILENAFKIKSIWRNVTIQQCMNVKSILNNFKDLLSEALKGTLTNEKIATFNNLAYKNVTKSRLKKRLDERTIKNIAQMEAIEERLQALIKSIDFDELDQNESEENKSTFTCTLTTDNYIEAMREGECMCLALDIARPEAAIADPTQLKIKTINQTFLTSDAFMTSVGHALEENTEENVHGGFQGPSFGASVIKGIAREDITGILPLYINEKHWQIAKERIKPILGYMTTLDVFGYSYAQLTTIPFLILGKAFTDTSMDFRRVQFKLILETCDAIYKQATNLREENKVLFEKYTKSPLNRTIDSVANHEVLFGHLLCAVRCGDVSLAQVHSYIQSGMIKYAVEETIRRRLNRNIGNLEEQLNNTQMLLGIDQKEYFDEPIHEFSKAYAIYVKEVKDSKKSVNDRYSSAFLAELALTNNTDQMEVESNYNKSEQDANRMDVDEIIAPTVKTKPYDSSKFKVIPTSIQVLNKIKNIMSESVEIILRYRTIFEWAIRANSVNFLNFPEFNKFVPEKTPYTDNFFKRFSPKVQLATILQAYIHRQNSTRREAAEGSTPTIVFFEPFSETTADNILSIQFDECVSSTLKRSASEIIASYTKQANNAVGFDFWEATSPEEAAGLLILDVKCRGTKIYAQIIKAFQKPHMPLAREKLEMMVSGSWKGVRLFKDMFTKLPEKAVWIPSRQNLYRTLTAQKESVPDVRFWTTLIPSAKTYIEHQFDQEYLTRRRREKWQLREQKRGHELN